MGYYLECPDGRTTDKANWLRQQKDVQAVIDWQESFDPKKEMPVCVVSNGLFDAMGIAFSQAEAQAFDQPDPRPKEWFLVPLELIQQQFPDIPNRW